jgi:uncharacterized phiE125 gp8 family phage protein
MALKLIYRAAGELLTIDELRDHLNIQPYDLDSDGGGTHPDDAQIMAMASAARAYCENFTGLVIGPATYELALDEFPEGAIELPVAPISAVEYVTVGSGSDALIDDSTYTLDLFSSPARLVPVTSWPSATAATNLIRVRFTAGYGVDSDSEPLPWEIRAAILLLVGTLYARREDDTDKPITSIPTGIDALLRPRRVRLGMA